MKKMKMMKMVNLQKLGRDGEAEGTMEAGPPGKTRALRQREALVLSTTAICNTRLLLQTPFLPRLDVLQIVEGEDGLSQPCLWAAPTYRSGAAQKGTASPRCGQNLNMVTLTLTHVSWSQTVLAWLDMAHRSEFWVILKQKWVTPVFSLALLNWSMTKICV